MLQTGTVEERTFELLKELMQEPLLASTRLVGGTSLALQIGHRKSTDLDLFTTEIPNIQEISEVLFQKYAYTPVVQTEKTTIGYIDGIKVDVIYHPYKWLKTTEISKNIRLASVEDIAAMKLHAIANSGERPKDFVDIAFLSQKYSYDTIKSLALEKYPMYDPIMIDRAIIYFDDVNKEAVKDIKMIGYEMDWERIKRRIVRMTDKPEHVFLNPPLEKQISLTNTVRASSRKKTGPHL